MRGVAQFKFTVFDPEINRLLRLAFYHKPINARELQLSWEKSTALGISNTATDRRFCVRIDATLSRDRRTCRHASHQSQNIIRSDWICAFWHLAQDVIHSHCTPTHIFTIEPLIWLLYR